MVTSSKDKNAFSLFVFSASFTLGFKMAVSVANSSYKFLMLPKRPIKSAAVVFPIPGTPGTLSELSPVSALKSFICKGVTPNRSTTFCESYKMVSLMLFPGVYTFIFSSTNCRLSRSPLTIKTLAPWACFLAIVAIKSSASNPSFSNKGMPKLFKTSLRIGNWLIIPSGVGARCAL